ncbi:hypothetical protein [Fuchsiella alkaliacetigena]|uniref:hypothetical protein n=1 Tax=Fuchsiella alkaliacetigena TaxID=957042 RepID=UPI00200B71DE|nr:hypothetical protein [Fuchsiella alkaliacetigena]MCK8825036.1 hypothetical protein [Fuchsiella alkaliacetigena]
MDYKKGEFIYNDRLYEDKDSWDTPLPPSKPICEDEYVDDPTWEWEEPEEESEIIGYYIKVGTKSGEDDVKEETWIGDQTYYQLETDDRGDFYLSVSTLNEFNFQSDYISSDVQIVGEPRSWVTNIINYINKTKIKFYNEVNVSKLLNNHFTKHKVNILSQIQLNRVNVTKLNSLHYQNSLINVGLNRLITNHFSLTTSTNVDETNINRLISTKYSEISIESTDESDQYFNFEFPRHPYLYNSAYLYNAEVIIDYQGRTLKNKIKFKSNLLEAKIKNFFNAIVLPDETKEKMKEFNNLDKFQFFIKNIDKDIILNEHINPKSFNHNSETVSKQDRTSANKIDFDIELNRHESIEIEELLAPEDKIVVQSKFEDHTINIFEGEVQPYDRNNSNIHHSYNIKVYDKIYEGITREFSENKVLLDQYICNSFDPENSLFHQLAAMMSFEEDEMIFTSAFNPNIISTKLTSKVAAADILEVESTEDFFVGANIIIGDETNVISSINEEDNKIILQSPLESSYAAGMEVMTDNHLIVPYTYLEKGEKIMSEFSKLAKSVQGEIYINHDGKLVFNTPFTRLTFNDAHDSLSSNIKENVEVKTKEAEYDAVEVTYTQFRQGEKQTVWQYIESEEAYDERNDRARIVIDKKEKSNWIRFEYITPICLELDEEPITLFEDQEGNEVEIDYELEFDETGGKVQFENPYDFKVYIQRFKLRGHPLFKFEGNSIDYTQVESPDNTYELEANKYVQDHTLAALNTLYLHDQKCREWKIYELSTYIVPHLDIGNLVNLESIDVSDFCKIKQISHNLSEKSSDLTLVEYDPYFIWDLNLDSELFRPINIQDLRLYEDSRGSISAIDPDGNEVLGVDLEIQQDTETGEVIINGQHIDFDLLHPVGNVVIRADNPSDLDNWRGVWEEVAELQDGIKYWKRVE